MDGLARTADARWMAAALGLARRAVGRASPNPAVACLIVRDDRLLARGVTAPGGRPHAEAVALAALGSRAPGATVYVTLEPCAHHGLTPPCADALIAAGVARVVCPLADPDPRVSGRGLARLEAAGIEVALGVAEAEARAVNAGFLSRIERARPHVTLKLATTLDGRIATATGESRWITGPASRARVHAMRAQADVVMIGIGTARADDPMLDVRGLSAVRQPVRLVVDPRLRLDPDARLVATARTQPLWLAHGPRADKTAAASLAERSARLVPCETQHGDDPDVDVTARLDLAGLLRRLAAEGLGAVLCEGGGTLAASLLDAGLVDRLALFQAGRTIGAEGRPALGPLGLARLAEAPTLDLEHVERIGSDVLSTWVTRARSEPA